MNTRGMIKVMQAHLDCKAIEMRLQGEKEWHIVDDPSWNWSECQYRVAMKWRCDCCHVERYDVNIAVVQHDLSGDFHLKPGTVSRNVKYCRDSQGCCDMAHDIERWRVSLCETS